MRVHVLLRFGVLYIQRGKFRPRLIELVRQNSSAEVEATTAAAIAALPDLERAASTATKLKAVGPATASGRPSHIDC